MLLLLLLAIANIIIIFFSFHNNKVFTSTFQIFYQLSPSFARLEHDCNTLLFFRALCEDIQKVVIERAGFGLEERRFFCLRSREESLGAKGTYIRDAEIIIDDRGRT
jgi:hypothetical protein